MAKLIGISEKILFLVLLGILVSSDALPGVPEKVCGRPSMNRTLQKSCNDLKACNEACKKEKGMLSGHCETLAKLNQDGYNKCVEKATKCANDKDGCIRPLDPFDKENCTSQNMIVTGKRCTCVYRCANPDPPTVKADVNVHV